jgi:hypothetical protein
MRPPNQKLTFSDKVHRAVDIALKNFILSKVPMAFNNSFKLDEKDISIDQDGVYYEFFITYKPTAKAPQNLQKYTIDIFITTQTDQYKIYLMDPEEGDFLLEETVEEPDALVGIYYKWVTTEFPKL